MSVWSRNCTSYVFTVIWTLVALCLESLSVPKMLFLSMQQQRLIFHCEIVRSCSLQLSPSKRIFETSVQSSTSLMVGLRQIFDLRISAIVRVVVDWNICSAPWISKFCTKVVRRDSGAWHLSIFPRKMANFDDSRNFLVRLTRRGELSEVHIIFVREESCWRLRTFSIIPFWSIL